MPRGTPIEITPEQLDWLRQHRPNMSARTLVAAWRARWGGPAMHADTLAKLCRRHGLRKSHTGRFRPGGRPWNAGLTGYDSGGRSAESRFRVGGYPHTTVPIGSYRKGKDGLWLVKVTDRIEPQNGRKASNSRARDWRYVHRLTYQDYHGQIPPGHVVILVDGDVDGCLDPDNVACLSRAELVRLNQRGFSTLPPDRALRHAAIARARLLQAAHDAARQAGLDLQARRKLLGRGQPMRPSSPDAAERLRQSQQCEAARAARATTDA